LEELTRRKQMALFLMEKLIYFANWYITLKLYILKGYHVIFFDACMQYVIKLNLSISSFLLLLHGENGITLK
jgi:hypothetical protein